MSTVSGTLTSSQGALVVETTAYDQLTITVSSGTFTLEYPMGTVLASGVTTTSSYQLGPGQFKLQVTAGSVSYSLERVSDGGTVQQSKVLTDAEWTILVAGSGLTVGTIYRVGTPEVWYRATGIASYEEFLIGAGADISLADTLSGRSVSESFTRAFIAWYARGAGDVTPTSLGAGWTATTGTATTAAWATTNTQTRKQRCTIKSAAGAGSGALASCVAFLQPSTGSYGGFDIEYEFGCSDGATVADASSFAGLSSTSSATALPDALNNCFGFGDKNLTASDGYLKLYHRDGSTAATVVTLVDDTNTAVNWPANDSTEVYVAKISNHRLNVWDWELTRCSTGQTITGSVTSSNVPQAGTALQLRLARANNATALAVDVYASYAIGGDWSVFRGPKGDPGVSFGVTGSLQASPTLNSYGMPTQYKAGVLWNVTYASDGITPLSEAVNGVATISRTFTAVAGSNGRLFYVSAGAINVGDALSLTDTQATALAAAAVTAGLTEGFPIWNTTTHARQYWDGSAWA